MSAGKQTDEGEQPAAVGYGHPPAEHRFKTGVSGNPKGRPKRKLAVQPRASDRPLSDLILQEAYRPIQIRENGKVEDVPMIQAVLRSLGVAAVKGSHRAQLAVTSLVQAIEERSLSEKQALFQTIVEYKRGWEEVFEICDSRGEPRPDPVPHPADIAINARTGEFVINGPFDDGEKARWDMLLARKKDAQDEIAWCREALESEPERRAAYEADIAFEQRLIDMIDTNVPDEKTRRVPGFDINEWQIQQKRRKAMRDEWRSQKLVRADEDSGAG